MVKKGKEDMKDHCLDIGIIQAFLDGELDHSQVAKVSNHIAICDGCTVMLADAENESAIVFPALERELNSLVPTQRLWYKINDSISEERGNRSFWQRTWAFLSVALVNPSLASAASLLIVFGIVAILWMGRGPTTEEFAGNLTPVQPVASVPASTVVTPETDEGPVQNTASDNVVETRPRVNNIERASYRMERPAAAKLPAAKRTAPESSVDPSYMPGEESYVKTIASLSRTLQGTKDGIMRPAQRIAYEKDMAVVNDAIDRMRQEVKRNPKNESAKQVLYSSYQNKIDLLNSVSQKQELMASITR
jgi:hypothetical protein